jgi:laminin alpha 3/5
MCLPRWVLVPDEGCHECDSCIHILLDEVEDLDSKVTVIMDDLDSVSVGVGAIRRLEAINNTAHNLRNSPDVDGLITRPSDPNLLDPLKSELQDLQTETQETRKRADKLMREADLVEADAADTRRDAEGLDDLVKMATDAADDAVRYAQDILDDILSSKEASDLDRMLREAEDMLTELKDRNFDAAEEKAENELDKAVEALNDAKKLFDQAAEQANRTRDLGISVTDIKDKLNDLMNNSRHALDNAQAANDLNIRNQKLLDKLRNTVADINDGKSNAEMTIQMTRDALDTARQYLEDARQAYIDAEQELSRLDPATADLRDFVNDLSTSNLELRPLVDNATEHALKLRKQAEFLDSMIADTRESAEGALNASQAYISIVDAINRAYDASLEATDDAEKALDLSNGLAAEAEQSKQRSTDLKATADETMATVTDELDPRLQDAIKLTDDVENLNQRIRDELNYINTELDQLPEDGYGAEAQAALDKAADAQVRADVARDKIRQIQDALPEDQRRIDQIPYDIEEANHNVDRAQASVDNVLKLVPDTVALLDKLQVRAEQVNQVGEDLTRDIEVLKENIGLARGEASRIRVGMQFLPESSLMLRNPPNMANAGSYSKLSLYFKTNQENGFLAYVGPDASSFGQLQTDDYMALEIIEGFVNFKFNLGTGVGVIVNNKNVADDQWHEVIAERNGRTATVTVRTEDETDSVASGTAEGGHSVLDIDPRFSKFYVGGVRDGAGLEGKVENTRFQGCIEDVKFDDSPIGLWDFVYGENNKQGCEARAGLEVAQPNGFRFNGDGYVVMEKEWYNPSKDATVSLKFRTFAENGLLFLMGDDQNSYLSIELKDGRILYQFDLGSGAAQLFTREFDDNGRKLKFNDGEWHQLETRRIDRNGKVTVDGVDLATGKSPGLQKKLTINNYIHVGGYKGEHKYADVTSIPFLGCIKDLQLGGNIRDMNDNMYAYGVTPGCAETARVVSFAEGGGGESYLAMPSVNVDANFQMTFKVKSENEDGLIFYVSDDQQSQQNAMSVSLSEGKIVMVSTVQGEQTKLESTGEKYNDGRWHYITVTKQGRTLQLDIDDREMISGSYDGKRRMDTTSYLYFGGLPFRPADNNAAAIVNYYGCIGDVTVNGNFLNFAAGDPNQRLGASLASCPITYTYDRIDMGDFTLPPLPVRPSPPTGEVDDTQCVLPLRPQIAAADPNSGTMFGSTPDSRWEYDTFPDTFRSRSEFSLDFKSTNPNGVMFYVADARQKDFISVYLRGGKVVYGFNCGNDAVFIESTETYNDGQWHTVEFQRVSKDGTLIVDGIDTNTGSTGGRSQSINVETPFYVGGMPQDQFALAQTNIEGLTNGLVGCIRNPALKDQPFGEPARAFDVQNCSENIEPGTFFGAIGGYAQLAQNLSVNLDLDIELDVRPRTKDGVLLSIIGDDDIGDFLVLQMVLGELLFSMDNGGGEVVTTSYIPPTQSTLCNGQWHKIRGQKAKNVITLEVDGVLTKPGVGEAGLSKTDTNDPLYVGGVPVRHRGIKTTLQFVGCIRNLKLTDTPVDMATLITDGDVTRGSCPTN